MGDPPGEAERRAAMHRVLATGGCRTVMRELRDRHAVAFDVLVECVGPAARGVDEGRGPEAGSERAAIRLYHSYLPRLEAVDAVVYDEGDGVVREAAGAPLAYGLLDAATDSSAVSPEATRNERWADDA
jgi:hypothetical protein